VNDPIRFRPGKIRDCRPRDFIVRFVFGAAVSLAAAVVGKVWGPAFGGLFLAFPAILPAALTLIEDKESRRDARHNDLGAIAGVPGLAVFGLAVWQLHENAWAALLVGFAGWMVVAIGLALLYRWVRRQRPDQGIHRRVVWRSGAGGKTVAGHDA
jgi:uncharacterized membrane protein (GlpM family)